MEEGWYCAQPRTRQVVRGTNDPASWEYLLTMNGPATSTTRRRRRDEVAALVYGPSPASPWKGNAPWQSAPLSSQLMAGIERQLSGEASSSSGYVIPMPDTGDRGQAADADGEDDPLTTLRRDMAASRGKTLLVPSLAGGLWCRAWRLTDGSHRNTCRGGGAPTLQRR